MNWFRNLKTARKLGLGFGICLLLASAVGVIAVTRMAALNGINQSLTKHTFAGMESVSGLNDTVRQARLDEFQHISVKTSAEKKTVEDEMADEITSSNQALADYAAIADTPADHAKLDTLTSAWQTYLASNQTLIALSQAHHEDQARTLLTGRMTQEFSTIQDSLDALVDFNHEQAKARAAASLQSYLTGRLLVVGLLLGSILLGAASGVLITNYITGSVSEISGRLEELRSRCITNLATAILALEGGDLTCTIATGTKPLALDSRDEFGAMAQTFNVMLDQVKSTVASFHTSQISLSALVRGLQQSSTQVAAAAETLAVVSSQVEATTEQISVTMDEVSLASEQSARGASEIAQGSGSQARSLSESTDLVKQLAEAVTGIAQEAEGAGRAAEKADAAANRGNKVVSETVVGMARIHTAVSESAEVIQALGEASSRIGTIVETINEIAGQTNLLALNAAIEAARAGEAGRGFAVVADEVRKLAERSSSATKEIGGLILDIQGRTAEAIAAMEIGTRDVAEGTSLAGQAGAALAEIQGVVAELSQQVQHIGAAAAAMSTNADGVSRSITEIAAVVEESSAAAEEMSASAEQVSASIQMVARTTSQQSVSIEKMVVSTEELSGVAYALDQTVARFTISDGNVCSDTSDLLGKRHLTLIRAA
ncbi:MAG: methyl-accepting chemotaxis protein [Janthinobacterium lividum]